MYSTRSAYADKSHLFRSLPDKPCPRCGGAEFRIASEAPMGYRCAYCRLAILAEGWKAYWPKTAP